MQLLHFRKRIGAGLWDLSLAEHLSPGESYRDAAIRGLGEELGIPSDQVTLQGPLTEPFRRRLQVGIHSERTDFPKQARLWTCMKAV